MARGAVNFSRFWWTPQAANHRYATPGHRASLTSPTSCTRATALLHTLLDSRHRVRSSHRSFRRQPNSNPLSSRRRPRQTAGSDLRTLGVSATTWTPAWTWTTCPTIRLYNNADILNPTDPRPIGTLVGGANGTLTFSFTTDFSQPPNPRPQQTTLASVNQKAAVVNAFYWCNWMHDRLYGLGFTEAAGNFQQDNFGRGGTGNDAVLVDMQNGLEFLGGSFSTPPDGSS